MPLAAALDYLKFWWHPVVGGVFVLVWLIGGTVLTRRVLAQTKGLTRPRQTTGYALNINFIANGAGLAAMAIVCGCLLLVASRKDVRYLVFLPVLGPLAMIGMAAAVLPFYFARARAAPTRGLLLFSTVPLVVAAVVLAAASLTPAYFARQKDIQLVRCGQRLRNISVAAEEYAQRNPGRPVPDLEQLAKQGLVEAQDLRCPNRPELEIGYLFCPPATYGNKGNPWRMVVWDRPANHSGIRHVVFGDGKVARLDAAQFAEYLRRPENVEVRAVEAAGGG